MTAEDIAIISVELAERRGRTPCRMRSDNGPQFAAEVVRSWPEETGSGSLFVAPGRADDYHDGWTKNGEQATKNQVRNCVPNAAGPDLGEQSNGEIGGLSLKSREFASLARRFNEPENSG
jgi:hypothetical protein